MSQGDKRPDRILVPHRHPEYYIEGADLHILASRVLFRVHGYFFSRESPIFNKKIHPASPGDVKEGSHDNAPIVLEDVSAEELEKLCWVFYNPRYSLYDASVADWSDILNLADKWDFDQVKELAVRELQKKTELGIVDKMALYEKYKVDKRHLVPLYAMLCQRDYPLTVDECKTLGFEATVIISTAREKLRSPSEGGRSPLPRDVEEGDVFRVLEDEMHLEAGSTAKFKTENKSQEPTSSPDKDKKSQLNHLRIPKDKHRGRSF